MKNNYLKQLWDAKENKKIKKFNRLIRLKKDLKTLKILFNNCP